MHEYSLDSLNNLYKSGECPKPSELYGDYAGTVPAVETNNILGKLSWPTYMLSKLGVIPWEGKSFAPNKKEGHNRLLFDRFTTAQFSTKIDQSWLDHNDCLLLDYNINKNPAILSVIRDEVRQVKNGILLGRMYFKPTKTFILYFALQRTN